MSIFKKFFAHNWWAILYFNFRMLPFKQAVKLPFDFYYKVRFENLSGKIQLDVENVHRAVVKIGGRGSEMFSRNSTIVDLKGVMSVNGIVEIGHGCLLRVDEGGVLTFGNNVRIGAMSKVFCTNEIKFGNELDLSWECQVFDTNFHFVRDVSTNTVSDISKPVIIGSQNWFGNRVTIMKGTVTPNRLIVASNSLCNKDYSSFPPNSVIGGIPARLIAENKARVFENLEDVATDEFMFDNEPNT